MRAQQLSVHATLMLCSQAHLRQASQLLIYPVQWVHWQEQTPVQQLAQSDPSAICLLKIHLHPDLCNRHAQATTQVLACPCTPLCVPTLPRGKRLRSSVHVSHGW
jgi:hypothetical protein